MNAQSDDTAASSNSDMKPSVSARFTNVISKEKLDAISPPFLSSQPVIDGNLNDAVWSSAVVLGDFFQVSPADNEPASRQTTVWLGYDRDNLFVAFKCFDERQGVRASVAKRDEIFAEDNVRIFLDTFNDRQRAYLLAFNPHGIQQDGTYVEPAAVDFSVDIEMESEGKITEDGWSVEIRIPFRSLRYPGGKPIVWGVHFVRYISRLNHESTSWMPYDRNAGTWLSQAGKLVGLESSRFVPSLQISPALSAFQTGSRRATFPLSDGYFENAPPSLKIGANIKAQIASGTVLDIAINPDFAEVEADSPVITENQRFPIFFEERRPFFLEGADIFSTPLQAFHSRTIVDPSLAAKMTFQGRKISWGSLVAIDDAPGSFSHNDLVNPTNRRRAEEFLGKRALSAVFRARINLGEENLIGVFSSIRLFPEQRNGVLGVDGKIRINRSLFLRYQAAFTRSKQCFFEAEFEPTINPMQADTNRVICQTGATQSTADPHFRYHVGNGIGYLVSLDRSGRNRGWYFEAAGRTKDYHAALGVERRTNTNRLHFANRFSSEAKPKSSIVRLDWRQFLTSSHDFQGRSQTTTFGSSLTANLQRNSRIIVEIGTGYERLVEEEFGLKRMPTRPRGAFHQDPERSAFQGSAEIRFTSQPRKQVLMDGFFHHTWGLFDLDRGAGAKFPRISPAALAEPTAALDPGPGRNLRLGYSIELKPTDRLRISGSYQQSKLVRYDNKMTAFDTKIVSLASTFQFSRFTYLRGRWDYNSASGSVSGQVIFGWTPSPGRSLYLGYSDRLNYNGFNPFTSAFEPGVRTNSRTFFVRWSHLLRWSL